MNTVYFVSFCILAALGNKKRESLFSPALQVLAHRGLTSKHLENTKEALVAALEEGADGIEFDVQLSLDQEPMVFHDHSVFRLCGIKKNIDDMKSAELSKIIQRAPQYEKRYHISTLRELLASFPVGKIINIELKETTALHGPLGIKHILKLIEPYKKKQTIIISSFDPDILKLVADEDKEYALGFLIDKKIQLNIFLRALKIIPMICCLNPHLQLITPRALPVLNKLNLDFLVWGHKELGSEKILLKMRRRAIISDIPERLLEK